MKNVSSQKVAVDHICHSSSPASKPPYDLPHRPIAQAERLGAQLVVTVSAGLPHALRFASCRFVCLSGVAVVHCRTRTPRTIGNQWGRCASDAPLCVLHLILIYLHE